MTIWLFYERQGQWGLRIDGRYTTAKTVDVRMPMRGRMRAGASPNAFMEGNGYPEWRGDHVVLHPICRCNPRYRALRRPRTGCPECNRQYERMGRNRQ